MDPDLPRLAALWPKNSADLFNLIDWDRVRADYDALGGQEYEKRMRAFLLPVRRFLWRKD